MLYVKENILKSVAKDELTILMHHFPSQEQGDVIKMCQRLLQHW